MDDRLLNFEQFKISAIDKVRKVEQNREQNAQFVSEQNVSKSWNTKNRILNGTNDLLKKNDINNMTITDTSVPMRHIFREIEIQRQEKVKAFIQTRMMELQEFSSRQVANKKQEWLKKQQAFIEDMQQKESCILQTLNECDRNNLKERSKLVQHYQELAERRKIQEIQLKAREKEIQNFSTNIDSIKKHQQGFRLIYEQLIAVIKSCHNNDTLKNLLGDDSKLLKTLPESLEEIIIKCKDGKVNEDEVHKAANIVSQILNLKTKVEKMVEKINEQKVQVPVEESPVTESISLSSNNETLQHRENSGLDKSEKLSEINSDITKYVSITNLKIYTEALEFLEKYSLNFKDLDRDHTKKIFKFECKKAVNIPVNSISAISSAHILDKYNKLHQLLSGQNVLVNGKLVNASSHPQGIAFCMDLLAKKFVLQGDLMVSSNTESAFCYASVIISLWNDFPAFGKLILAYFYKFCPYLVPYYIPREIGETDEDFYKKQGYQYNDGQIEKQDKFLKRMTGIMRLYAAILITKPKKGQIRTPHDIQNGWRWLSSVLKLEPRLDITATMLHTFLETVGFQMEAKYGRVFFKLNKIIAQIFLPSCRQKCTGGAVTRLELLLSEYEKNKKYSQPNGYLSYVFW